MKILLVDDEPSVLSFLNLLFDEAGYETICAPDGLTGLRRFIDSRPDVAVIDLLMPHMGGMELCSRIREISSIPILVLTAVDLSGDRINAFQVGADDYVTKPVSGRELVARVKSRLRRSQWASGGSSPVASISRPAEFQTPGHSLSLERLLTGLWGPAYHPLKMLEWRPEDHRN